MMVQVKNGGHWEDKSIPGSTIKEKASMDDGTVNLHASCLRAQMLLHHAKIFPLQEWDY